MSTEFDLTADFIVESKENLAVAEEDFLELEHQTGAVDEELINRTFRCVHSIKGGAGFLGLKTIGELAHAMEAVMDLIRKGHIIPNSEIVSTLLSGVDHLNEMFNNVEGSNEYDTSEIHGRLELINPKGGGTQAVASKPQAPPKDTFDQLLSRYYSNGKIVIRLMDECIVSLKHHDPASACHTWLVSTIDSIHSLQSDAMALEFGRVLDFITAVESILSLLRDDRLQYDEKAALFLDEALTVLLTLVDEHHNPEEVDTEEIMGHLSDLVLSLDKSEESAVVGEEPVIDEIPAEAEQERAVAISKPKVSHEVTQGRIIHPKQENATPIKKAAAATETLGENETIRVKVSLLNHLMSLAGELVLVRNQQLQLVEKSNTALRNNTQKLDMVTSELQECVMQTRMQPVGLLFNRFNRVVRDLGNKLKKEIRLVITGSDVDLDKSILEALADPLTHLIRNACDHGVETPEVRLANGKDRSGTIHLAAWHEGGQVHIEIRDDGNGIDAQAIKAIVLKKGLKREEEVAQMSDRELLHLILLPGFTTAKVVTDVSGRGVGMDVVRSNIEKIGGSLELDSAAGKGSAVRLRLPLTLAIIPCLIIRVGHNNYAIPQVNLEELVTLYNEEVFEKIEIAHGSEVFRLRKRLLPMLRLSEILSHESPLTRHDRSQISQKYREHQRSEYQAFLARRDQSTRKREQFRQSMTFAVLKVGDARYGLIVDEVLGTEEVVVKSMHPRLKDLRCYAGATVMGDGRVALILDVTGIAKHGGIRMESQENTLDVGKTTSAADAVQSILLFQYGSKEQFAVPLNMISRIERIALSDIEMVGDAEFITIDSVSTKILRMDELLSVSSFVSEKTDAFLLLPKMTKKPVGILISQINDSLEYLVDLNTSTYQEDGLLGTALINERMTLFVDIFSLISKLDPDHHEITRRGVQETPKKVLLVEDISFFRTLVKGYLSSFGFVVTTAVNGQDALEKLRNDEFDLIVSDLEMPVMNGFDFMRAVRTIFNNPIPAVALTALDSEQDVLRAEEVGFNAFEVKIDRDNLIQTIQSLI